jgi:hypothetical protein
MIQICFVAKHFKALMMSPLHFAKALGVLEHAKMSVEM